MTIFSRENTIKIFFNHLRGVIYWGFYDEASERFMTNNDRGLLYEPIYKNEVVLLFGLLVAVNKNIFEAS